MTSIERSKKRLSFSAPVAKPKGCGQASQGSERHCWRKPAWLFGFGCQWQPIRDSRAIVWIQCYATKRRVLDNGRFLRHRFSPKPKVIATANSLPKKNTLPKRRCPRRCKPERDNGASGVSRPNIALTTKPRPRVKNMLGDPVRYPTAPSTELIVPAFSSERTTIVTVSIGKRPTTASANARANTSIVIGP